MVRRSSSVAPENSLAALRAAILLAVNVVCVNLAALAVFAYKGVRPRTWREQVSAEKAQRVYAAVLIFLLALLTGAILIASRTG